MPGNENQWSVTEILQVSGLGPNYSGIDPDVLDYAAGRGIALNVAIDLHEDGDLDEESLHPEIRPAFDCYREFKRLTGYERIEHQGEYVHPEWNYILHHDAVGWMGRRRVMLDWKFVASMDQAYVSYQVRAGYRLGWNACRPKEQIQPEDCYGLQFTKGGTYKLRPLTHPHAEQVFLAAVVTTQERIRTGKLKRDDLRR